MVQPEIVAYLQAHLNQYPVDKLREQLASEGVSDLDFDEALRVALRTPRTEKLDAAPKKKSRTGVFFGAGLALLGAVAGFLALQGTSEKAIEAPPAPPPAAATVGESAFVGQSGYVIRLPKGYTTVTSFKDEKKVWEVVHFCRVGTDPTNFLNEGLFGQLGIVRLEVEPSPLAGNLTGVETLSRIVTGRLQARGDKFSIKNIQASSLRGIQVTTELPNPGVEAFILGQRSLYRFTAGQEDEIYLDIRNSLRDPHSEN